MYAVPSLYASVIQPDAAGLSRACFLSCARDALTEFDSHQRRTLTSVNRGVVIGDSYCVTVDCNEFGEFGPCATFTVFPHHPAQDSDEDVMNDILKECVAHALMVSEADFIEWHDPEQILDIAEFEALWIDSQPVRRRTRRMLVAQAEHEFAEALAARADEEEARIFEDAQSEKPAAPENHWRLKRAEELLHNLRDKIMDEDPAELRLKAASWSMTGVLATMAPPVGAAVAVLNAGKGSDLRLSAHALAVTGSLTVMHGAGLLAVL